ncbi:MAG: dienelactone hydrolase family protein, partial [Thermohalobaculum sp.]|nr:dienelactone hydrolase family protein [Thermohalobaculum sp.]
VAAVPGAGATLPGDLPGCPRVDLRAGRLVDPATCATVDLARGGGAPRVRGLGLGLAVAALAACTAPEIPGQGSSDVTLELAGRADAPLMIVLHGPEGQAARLRRLAAFGLGAEGWTIAWPDARGRGWMDPASDEAGRLGDLAARLAAARLVDPDRVVVAGFSDGGQLALRLACERPELVAGVAAVMASLPEGAPCPDGVPVPVLMMQATTDPILPFDGGTVARPGVPEAGAIRLAGPVLAAGETAAILAHRNGCGAARTVEVPDLFPDDGARVAQRVYEGCRAPTVQVVIEGGGHAWPGTRLSAAVEAVLGAPVRDISATLEIEAFAREAVAGRRGG